MCLLSRSFRSQTAPFVKVCAGEARCLVASTYWVLLGISNNAVRINRAKAFWTLAWLLEEQDFSRLTLRSGSEFMRQSSADHLHQLVAEVAASGATFRIPFSNAFMYEIGVYWSQGMGDRKSNTARN